MAPFHPWRQSFLHQTEFVEHKNFDKGYRKGYAVGYTDAFSGRSFRAMLLVQLAKANTKLGADGRPDRRFDEVFLQGYEAGQKAGLKDGRSATAAGALNPNDCGRNVSSDDADHCAAYQGGYRLGYSDGYAYQHDAAPVMAQK